MSTDAFESENRTLSESLFCNDLPTSPQPQLGKILVSGASGYIGGRLVPELIARGYRVRAMVRADREVYQQKWPDAEVVVADALNYDSVYKAMEGVYCAYYLIHSLLRGSREFEGIDVKSAATFRDAAQARKINRIIYLSGLGDYRTSQSAHLRSRSKVAVVLSEGSVPVTTLKAAVIIGSGSASYEIIRNLVHTLRFAPIPHWARNKCQPVSVRDVIKYLVGVLEAPETTGKPFDIGGNDILSYEQMLRTFAETTNKKIFFFRSPISNIRFFSYMASLLTPVPSRITSALIEGLKDEVICRNDAIKKLIPFKTLSYKEAIVMALTREEQDKVHTRWSDAYPPAYELALKLRELKQGPAYTASYDILSDKSAGALFRSICNIGGKAGWFDNNWMWRARGGIDRIFSGVGSARGRKRQHALEINDVIDFWRVEVLQPEKRLLLRSEMILPGKAWLEFRIDDENNRRRLTITAFFHTKSLVGKIYWYIFLPFHHFIFTNLIKQIENRSN